MKTTLTTADMDQLTFAAGVLRSASEHQLSSALLGLRDRQRELKDKDVEPEVKQPEHEVPATLPKRFRYTKARNHEQRIGELKDGGRVAIYAADGWRTLGYFTIETVRANFAAGHWRYDGAVLDGPADIVDPFRRMEEKMQPAEALAEDFLFRVAEAKGGQIYRAQSEDHGERYFVTDTTRAVSAGNGMRYARQKVAANLRDGSWVIVPAPVAQPTFTDTNRPEVRRGC